MKNIIKALILAVALCCAAAILFAVPKKGADKKLILINKFVDHPALDETARGIIDALAAAGFVNNETATVGVESAQANPALASQISNKFANQSPDVVICIGTVSSQSMVKYASKGLVKMVFSSITDPIGAGLVKDLNETGGNVSGVSNFISLEPQLELMKKIQPQLKKLGIIYNAGEINSVSIIEKLNAIGGQFDLEIIPQAVVKTSDVPQAATKLASTVDAVFISNDNTALSCLPSIVRACNMANIPVYVSDTDAVPLGALAALGPNQYAIGRQTGKMAARILNGESIAALPVEFPTEMELVINADAAKLLEIPIPRDVIASATKVIDSQRK